VEINGFWHLASDLCATPLKLRALSDFDVCYKETEEANCKDEVSMDDASTELDSGTASEASDAECCGKYAALAAPPGRWCTTAPVTPWAQTPLATVERSWRSREPSRASASSSTLASTDLLPHCTPPTHENDDEAPSLFAMETRTTVMLRHLPQDLSRDQLVEILENAGFKGKFDFLYLPRHMASQGNLGYAFVNVTSPDVLPGFWAALNGFRKWPIVWKRPCKVSWSVPFQGVEEHKERYRNSRLLHSSVPDEIRPILLQDGVRVDFPPPTRALRAPRVRSSKGPEGLTA